MTPGVLILAGGEASRLPGKLEARTCEGLPLVVAVYEHMRAAGPVYVSARGNFLPGTDWALPCPIIIDRFGGRGPLGGIATALPRMETRLVFLVAADAPFVTAETLDELRSFWDPGLEAVVPVNAAGVLEPLCALYERLAL